MGGVCFKLPTNFCGVSNTISLVMWSMGFLVMISPSQSPVVVEIPNNALVLYTLVHRVKYGCNFLVPLPTPMISTPRANGSRVPPWPILTCNFLTLFLILSLDHRDVRRSSIRLLRASIMSAWNAGDLVKTVWILLMNWALLTPRGFSTANTPFMFRPRYLYIRDET